MVNSKKISPAQAGDQLPIIWNPRTVRSRIIKSERPCNPYTGEMEPSKTIPDQTMSIRELLARHLNGLPVEGSKNPVYNGDEVFLPDPKSLDLVDIQRMSDQNKSVIDKFSAENEKAKKAKQRKEADQQAEIQRKAKLFDESQKSTNTP